MKKRPAIILVMLSAALFYMTTSAYAQSENPFIGTWDINLSESDFGSATPPQSMSRTYADLGDGNYM